MAAIFTKEKFFYIKKTVELLGRYKWLTALIVILSMVSTVLDGFGMGTLIPLLQEFSGSSSSFLDQFSVVQSFYAWGAGFGIPPFGLLAGFVIGMIILKNIFSFLNMLVVSRVSYRIRSDLQVELFNILSESSMSFFSSTRSGHLIGSISSYTDSISTFIFSFLNAVMLFTRSAIYLVMLFFISKTLTTGFLLFGLALTPFLALLFYRLRQTSRHLTKDISSIFSFMTEIFHHISLIKIFGTESYEKDRFYQSANRISNHYIRMSKYVFLLRPLSEVLVVILLGLLLIVVRQMEFLAVGISLPLLATYLVVFFRFFEQAGSGMSFVSGIFQHIEPFQAYMKLLRDARASAPRNGRVQVEQVRTGIELRGVSFAYPDGKSVFEKIDITIPKGKTVAIVGSTGAGKSTIVNLIAGLYAPTAGQVCVDGVNLEDIDQASWRKRIGYVSQDILLFNDTVKNNIRYGHFSATDDEVMDAAKRAHIHDYVLSLEKGYDTILGERGMKLSGGQRQRLAIARALVRTPDLIILDEATSALDQETERLVEEEIFHSPGRTCIAIAHRLSTIRSADAIVVLKDGRITEQGTHEELLLKNGFYAYLYQLQMKDGIPA